jgi:hypothetical protein
MVNHITVLGIAELCLAIVSYVFDPDDVVSSRDIYSLRLASHGFSYGIINVVTLRSISIRWKPSIPPGYRSQYPLGATRPKDSRPLFDAREFASGSLLPDIGERYMVKEMLVSTGETYDHDGRYPFNGNRHLIAELVLQLRSGFVDVEQHPLQLIIIGTSYWDWGMISGLTQALEGEQALHIEFKPAYYFPVVQNLDGIGLPSFHFQPILNDTNPHRVQSPLDALPRFFCDTLVLNQIRYDPELYSLLQASPERLRHLVVKMVAGENVVINLTHPMPLPLIFATLVGINRLTWEVDVDGSRPNDARVKRLHKMSHLLAGRFTLLFDILSHFPSDNNLQFLDLILLIGAPFDDRAACVQLHLTVRTALRLLAKRLDTATLENVLLSIRIDLRPSSNLDQTNGGDFTAEGLRIPDYKFRAEKEQMAAEFSALQADLAACMQPGGREFLWMVTSSEKSDLCTLKRERHWEWKDDLKPWDIDNLFPSSASPSTRPAPGPPPRYVVIRAFTERRLPSK